MITSSDIDDATTARARFDAIVGEDQRIRSEIERAPADALRALGVSDVEIERLMVELSRDWRARHPAEAENADASRRWWCTTSTEVPVAACDREVENCNLARDAMIRRGNPLAPCKATLNVWCFRVRLQSPDPNLNGTISVNCSPERAWCERDLSIATNLVGSGCEPR